MCLGVPLQVASVTSQVTVECATGDIEAGRRQVNTGLLDAPPVAGDWLLVHMDVAIRALSKDEAQQIGDALRAVTAAAAGEPFEHLIADLIDREPQLPEHLRAAEVQE